MTMNKMNDATANPFLSESGSGFFSDHVEKEVACLNVGDSKKFNKLGADVATCRMTISYVSRKLNIKIKTKVAGGNLWIKRVK